MGPADCDAEGQQAIAAPPWVATRQEPVVKANQDNGQPSSWVSYVVQEVVDPQGTQNSLDNVAVLSEQSSFCEAVVDPYSVGGVICIVEPCVSSLEVTVLRLQGIVRSNCWKRQA